MRFSYIFISIRQSI